MTVGEFPNHSQIPGGVFLPAQFVPRQAEPPRFAQGKGLPGSDPHKALLLFLLFLPVPHSLNPNTPWKTRP